MPNSRRDRIGEPAKPESRSSFYFLELDPGVRRDDDSNVQRLDFD
jgi:hypothetical protein